MAEQYIKEYTENPPEKDTMRCKWALNTTEKSPHFHEELKYERPLIYDNVLDVIGNTPLIRLNKIPAAEGVGSNQFLAKCEFLNPGGSVKDRIGRRMVVEAEREGQLKKGDMLIEATSGNTGIGLTLAARVSGYEATVTMPEKMSYEKRVVLSALGAKIHRTPTECAFNDYDSHLQLAFRLLDQIPNSHILDQYKNVGNPIAHYDGLGAEIWHQTSGKVDAVFIGTGTGGTMAGVGRYLKEKNPNIKVIGVDPYGSILAMPQELNERKESYLIEGTGYDFIPRTIDRTVVDHWIKTTDKPCLEMGRRMISDEGLLVGGTSGAALHAAIEYAKENKWENKTIVFVCPDNLRNYLTKYLSNEWLCEKNIRPYSTLKNDNHLLAKQSLDNLTLKPIKVYSIEDTIQTGRSILDENNTILLQKDNKIAGYVSHASLINAILTKQLKDSSILKRTMLDDFALIKYEELDVPILQQLLQRHNQIYIQKANEYFSIDNKELLKLIVNQNLLKVNIYLYNYMHCQNLLQMQMFTGVCTIAILNSKVAYIYFIY